MLDLLIINAALPGQDTLTEIGCKDGRIVAVEPSIKAEAAQTIDAKGYLVTPPFVDSHFHMDATLSAGMPRRNESGTLLEGIRIWGELKPDLTPQGLKERALKLLRWSVAKGNLAIRTHVDTTDPTLMAVDVLLEVREEMKAFVDIQLVAFPQDGVLRAPRGVELLERALDKGVDVVGGIPHFERTMEQGRESVRVLCEIAARRGLMVDMHCDESDDPHSRHVESLAFETQRLGLHGRVAGSHLTSMHSMDNYYVSKLLPLMADAQMHCVCNPLVNMNLQGRHDTYPKRRGLMRVPELMDQPGLDEQEHRIALCALARGNLVSLTAPQLWQTKTSLGCFTIVPLYPFSSTFALRPCQKGHPGPIPCNPFPSLASARVFHKGRPFLGSIFHSPRGPFRAFR